MVFLMKDKIKKAQVRCRQNTNEESINDLYSIILEYCKMMQNSIDSEDKEETAHIVASRTVLRFLNDENFEFNLSYLNSFINKQHPLDYSTDSFFLKRKKGIQLCSIEDTDISYMPNDHIYLEKLLDRVINDSYKSFVSNKNERFLVIMIGVISSLCKNEIFNVLLPSRYTGMIKSIENSFKGLLLDG